MPWPSPSSPAANCGANRRSTARALLAQALDGRVQAHHRVLIRGILDHVQFLEGALEVIDAPVEHWVHARDPELALLQSIPGVQRTAAVTILAEIGPDMSGSRECPPSSNCEMGSARLTA